MTTTLHLDCYRSIQRPVTPLEADLAYRESYAEVKLGTVHEVHWQFAR